MRALWPALVFVIAAAGPVHAQKEVREARAHFRRGNALYAEGKFSEALQEYLASRKLVDRPSAILNIAQCYRQLHKPAEAIEHYKQYLAKFKPGEEVPHREEVEGFISSLSAELEKARPPAPAPSP